MAKSQITLFVCPECGGRGQIPIDRWEFEICPVCRGKKKVSKVPYRDYVVISSLQKNDN